MPERARERTRPMKVRERPKKVMERVMPRTPVRRTGFRPMRSERRPHWRTESDWAAKKTDVYERCQG